MAQQSINPALFSWVHHPLHHILFKAIPNPLSMRFVGGCVRNTLQGKETTVQNNPPEDIDLATSYTPQEMMAFLKKNKDIKVIPTGLKHGTITAIIKGQPYEITTLRQDLETDGRHATIQYTDSWILDAQRRDFTINALYVDCQGKLYDPVGGYDDICQKKLRFIGNPIVRIQEDALRIVRFFRFWATFHYTPDPDSLHAVCHMKNTIDRLSGERITHEMLKMLAQENPWHVIDYMEKNGFMTLVFGCKTHTENRDNLVRLEKEMGFFDPWVRIRHMCHTIPPRFVLSKAQKKRLHHLGGVLDWNHARQSAYEHGICTTKKHLFLTAAQNMNTHRAHTLKKLANILKDMDCFSFPPLPVSGHDVKKMGFTAEKIGHILKICRQWWITQGSRHGRQECLDYIKKMTRSYEDDTIN